MTVEQMREPAGSEFRSARLDGSGPQYHHRRELSRPQWGTWRRRGFRCGTRDTAPAREMLDPESIAELIWKWLIEPCEWSVSEPPAFQANAHRRYDLGGAARCVNALFGSLLGVRIPIHPSFGVCS